MYKYALLCLALFLILLSGCGDTDEGPDLIVTELEITSWTPDSIAYSFTITNNGGSPANLDGPTDAESDNVSVQAFLSADTVFNNNGDIAAGGTILGTSPLGELAPGESMTGSFSSSAVVNPDATPYLVLMVDWGDVVEEADEDNNTLTVEIPWPDLVVSDLTVTSWTSDSIEYSYTITNNGNMAANLDGPTAAENDNVSVQAYLSADTVFEPLSDLAAGGTVLGYSPLGDLAPGESMTGSFSSSVVVDPAATPYLVLMVDWGEVVDESDEDNNTLAVEIPWPDLVVSDLSVISWTSGSIEYSYTITNNGNIAANLEGPTATDYDNVSVQAYLSADTVFEPGSDLAAGGTVVGYSPLGDLSPGESMTGSFSSTVVVDPAATPYLVLMVDWGEVVYESNEDNNTLAVAIPLPDLVVSDLTVISWTANTIQYAYTITNIGDYPANLDGPTENEADNVSVQAYLSADTVFSPNDDIAAGGTVLGYSPLGMLEPGESFDGQFSSGASVNPEETPYLTLKVDWGDVVDESDETNNTFAVEIE